MNNNNSSLLFLIIFSVLIFIGLMIYGNNELSKKNEKIILDCFKKEGYKVYSFEEANYPYNGYYKVLAKKENETFGKEFIIEVKNKTCFIIKS